MEDFSLKSEEYLYLLWIPLLLTFLLIFFYKKRSERVKGFFSRDMENTVFNDEKRKREKWSIAITLTAVLLIFISLLGPRYGYQWVDVKRKGVDIMLVVDLSSSMLAEDISPNRLTRAKYKIFDLLDMMRGDRIGLVIFAGDAFVQCPLTLDYGTIRMFIENLNTDLIPIQGTSIAKALEKAMMAFNIKQETTKVILLISDGEDTVENPLVVAEKAKNEDVRIYTIGIGGQDGVPIPDQKMGGFKKDENGDMVLTRLNPVQLQNIAEISGGRFVQTTTGNVDLQSIYLDEIKAKLKESEFKESRKKEWREQYQWFLFPAILLLLFEFVYMRRKANNTFQSNN